MVAHHCLQTPDLYPHFSARPITLLLLFMNGLCLLFPNCLCRCGNDTDVRHTRRPQAAVEGCQMRKEMQVDLQENPAHLLPPAFEPQCQYLGQLSSLKWALGETRRPVSYGDLSSTHLLLFSCTFFCRIPFPLPCKKGGDTAALSLDEILLQKLLAPYTMAL